MSPNSNNLIAFQYNASIDHRMKELCEPLKYLGLTHFGYLKFFKDGTYLKLGNDLRWIENYLKNNLADKTEAFAESLKLVPRFKLDHQIWPQSKGQDCIAELYNFNICNGINFCYKSDDYIEVYYFATKKDNDQIINIYMNHLPCLQKFSLFFKDKAKDLININDHNKLACQDSNVSFFDAVSAQESISTPDINSFAHDTKINRYFLNGKYWDTYLTKQEALCLKYLSIGRTTKEIGKIISLSSRTVESYIENIKLKLGVRNTSIIIDIFLENNLTDILSDDL